MENYNINSGPSLSLPIRMEKKRKKTQAGIGSLVVGVGAASAAVYSFMHPGSEVIGVYTSIIAVATLGLGISLLGKAAKSA